MANVFDYFILIIAFIMSLLLLVLILFRTPPIMKSYVSVLLCGWFADFTFNVCALIGRPLYYYHDGVMYMVSAMFASTINSHAINLAGVIIWIYGFMQVCLKQQF